MFDIDEFEEAHVTITVETSKKKHVIDIPRVVALLMEHDVSREQFYRDREPSFRLKFQPLPDDKGINLTTKTIDKENLYQISAIRGTEDARDVASRVFPTIPAFVWEAVTDQHYIIIWSLIDDFHFMVVTEKEFHNTYEFAEPESDSKYVKIVRKSE